MRYFALSTAALCDVEFASNVCRLFRGRRLNEQRCKCVKRRRGGGRGGRGGRGGQGGQGGQGGGMGGGI